MNGEPKSPAHHPLLGPANTPPIAIANTPSIGPAIGSALERRELGVELRDVTVRYGALVANRDVSLVVAPGEVHALVGENGAGKSTLMRALYGLAPIASGEVRIGGVTIARPSPEEAIARGLGMVHQHFMLVESLTVAENVVLGREPRVAGPLGWLGVVDRRRAVEETRALARRHGLEVDAQRRVSELSVGEQQRVEILKVLHRGARILVLDEPTAVLSPPEAAQLLDVLRALRDAGGTVLLVTHKLDEVMAIADRITVLRRGEVSARFERGEATPASIARAMVGREPVALEPRWAAPDDGAPPRLEVRGLRADSGSAGDRVVGDGSPSPSRRALHGIDLVVRGGEILGVAGVDGNGQAELVDAIVGLVAQGARGGHGEVLLDGADVTRMSPRARRRRGLGYVPEDRHRRGLVLDWPLADNLLLGREERYQRALWTGWLGLLGGWLGLIDRERLVADTRRLLDDFDVRPADPFAPARALSGGNQQKLVLARELARRPGVLIAAQPTRGVDVGAIERIHRDLDALRAGGAAVLLLSAELDELLALSDRIAVMLRGRIVATLARSEATSALLGSLMTGASPRKVSDGSGGPE